MPGSNDYYMAPIDEHFYQFEDTNIIIVDFHWFIDYEEVIDDWLIENTRDITVRRQKLKNQNTYKDINSAKTRLTPCT